MLNVLFAPMFALIAALATTLALGGNAQAAPPPPASVPAATTVAPTAAASPKPSASVPAAAPSASRPVMAALRPEGEIKCPVKGSPGSFKTFKVAWSVSPVSAPVWTAKSRAKTSPMPPAGLCGRYGEDMIAVVQGSTRDNDALSQLCLEAERSLIATASTVWTQREGVHGTATGVTPTQGAVAVYCVPYSVALAQRNVQLGITTVSVDNDPDKDGIVGSDDRCPSIPGIKENQGCPDNDTDGDSIVDRLDKCLTQPGIAPDGCPVKTVAAEPAPPAAATVLVAAPAETPKTDNTLYGYLRIGVLVDIRYVAPLGSSDYASPLHRGADVGGRLVVEYDRIAASRWGLRTNVGAGFHPYVFGQANLVSTNSATVVWDVQAMYHIARTVTVAIGPGVIATHLASDGARQLIAGVGRLSVRYAPAQKKGLYADLGLGLGGGHNTERGYPERDVFVVETGIGVGYAWPVKFPF